MSFRIDDILKQNSSKERVNVLLDDSSFKNEFNSDVTPVCTVKNTSILEYTLTNRNYYGSQVQQELYNNRYSTSFDDVTSNYRDPYFAKPASTRCPYTRDPIWTNYVPYPMMFHCPHLNARRKGGQIRFTTSQTEELEKQFSSHKYLSPEDRKQLADFLRLSDRQTVGPPKKICRSHIFPSAKLMKGKWGIVDVTKTVKTWFQNRRAKWRRNNQLCSSRTSDLLNLNIQETGLPDISNTRITYPY